MNHFRFNWRNVATRFSVAMSVWIEWQISDWETSTVSKINWLSMNYFFPTFYNNFTKFVLFFYCLFQRRSLFDLKWLVYWLIYYLQPSMFPRNLPHSTMKSHKLQYKIIEVEIQKSLLKLFFSFQNWEPLKLFQTPKKSHELIWRSNSLLNF